MTVTCVWCGEELRYVVGKGWVHLSDGQLYKKRPDGTDDHCALPSVENPIEAFSTEDKGATFRHFRFGMPVEAVVAVGSKRTILRGLAKTSLMEGSWKYGSQIQFSLVSSKQDPAGVRVERRNESKWNVVEINIPYAPAKRMIQALVDLLKQKGEW